MPDVVGTSGQPAQKPGPFRRLLSWIGRGAAGVLRCLVIASSYLGILFSVISPTRVALVLLLTAGAALILAAQGREISLVLEEAVGWKSISASIAFGFAVLWWSLQSWLWSRVALELDFGTKRANWSAPAEFVGKLRAPADYSARLGKWRGWLIKVLPRTYAFAIFCLAAWSLNQADGINWFWPAFAVVAGVFVLTVLIYRYEIAARLRRASVERDVSVLSFTKRVDEVLRNAVQSPRTEEREPVRRTEVGQTRFRWTLYDCLFVLAFVVAAALFAAILLWTVPVTHTLGAAALAFLAIACMLPVFGTLSALSRWSGFPFVPTLIVLAILFGPINDNHRVPPVGGRSSPDAAAGSRATIESRPSIEDATRQWLAFNGAARKPVPIVFVYAAGGGLRAAYWAAHVIGTAQQLIPCFDSRLFSLSGVSGGSVGGAVFLAALADEPRGTAPAPVCDPARVVTATPPVVPGTSAPDPSGQPDGARVAKKTRAALSYDSLSPTVGVLLYLDAVQRFLPLSALPDSAQGLAWSWESGWSAACADQKLDLKCGNPRRLASAFLEQWKAEDKRWRPALFLNGTHVETGKRIITSNLKVNTRTFLDAFDFHALVSHDVAVSMAALNSSRFPLVTAPGTLVDEAPSAHGQLRGNIVDGGYFENYGALTTWQAARRVMQVLADEKIAVQPIFVEILTDPTLGVADLARVDYPPPTTGDFLQFGAPGSGSPLRFMKEILGPPVALYNVYPAHAIAGGKQLASDRGFLGGTGTVQAPKFVRFRVCPARTRTELPLGWLMSKRSRDELESDLPLGALQGTASAAKPTGCVEGNVKAFRALADLLAPK